MQNRRAAFWLASPEPRQLTLYNIAACQMQYHVKLMELQSDWPTHKQECWACKNQESAELSLDPFPPSRSGSGDEIRTIEAAYAQWAIISAVRWLFSVQPVSFVFRSVNWQQLRLAGCWQVNCWHEIAIEEDSPRSQRLGLVFYQYTYMREMVNTFKHVLNKQKGCGHVYM